MSRARNRPPKLEPRVGAVHTAPAPTLEQLVERAKIAGVHGGPGPGPKELRRYVERLVAGDRLALGELEPVAGLTLLEGWAALTEVFGATPDHIGIDPARTIAGTLAAVDRVCEVAQRGGRIALATAHPASLLTLHLAFATLAASGGAEIADLADVGPIRADGRAARWLRWVDGVAMVTDGHELAETRDGEAAREWLFVVPRPALVVADGPFAEVAWDAGVEVVAFAGLERPGLAVAAARSARCTVIPLRTDRSPRSYEPIRGLVRGP